MATLSTTKKLADLHVHRLAQAPALPDHRAEPVVATRHEAEIPLVGLLA